MITLLAKSWCNSVVICENLLCLAILVCVLKKKTSRHLRAFVWLFKQVKIRKAIPDKTLFIGYNETYCLWHIINSWFTFSNFHICYFALHFHFHFTPLAGTITFGGLKSAQRWNHAVSLWLIKKVYFYFLLIFEPLYKIFPSLCVARRPYNRNSLLPWGTMESCSCLTLPTALWTMQVKKKHVFT